MKVHGLILFGLAMVASAVHADGRGQRGCAPHFGPPKTSARGKITRVRLFADAFAAFEADGPPARRLEALAEALAEFRRAERNNLVGRMFQARLKTVKVGLHRHLFDRDADVRWGAAYAIAALQNRALPVEAGSLVDHRSDAHEVKVKHELRSYLRSHQSGPFTYVAVRGARAAATCVLVELHVEVADELRVPFATGPFVMDVPEWVTATPTLEVAATEYFSRVTAHFELTGRRTDRLHLDGSFTLVIPKAVVEADAPVFVNLRLDGHALEQKILTASDLGLRAGRE